MYRKEAFPIHIGRDVYRKSANAINERTEVVEVGWHNQSVLGYVRWENFTVAIQRAVESCKTQGVSIDDHFREVTKMIDIGKGDKRNIRPEELPPADDIKKLERKAAREDKEIERTTKKLLKG